MSNLFQLPKPKLVKEANQRNQNHNVARDGKDLKVKVQTSLSRPLIPDHICVFENYCTICIYWINKIDKERQHGKL